MHRSEKRSSVPLQDGYRFEDYEDVAGPLLDFGALAGVAAILDVQGMQRIAAGERVELSVVRVSECVPGQNVLRGLLIAKYDRPLC